MWISISWMPFYALNNTSLSVVREFNYLGVTIDRFLNLTPQANKIINLTKVRLSQLRNIRENTDLPTTLIVYTTMVRPILEYCSFVLDGGPVWVGRKLQKLQNDALRIMERVKDPRDMHVDELHRLHDLEKLQPRRERQLLGLMYDHAQIDTNLLVPARALRGNSKLQLKTRRLRKDIYTKSPMYRGTILWNRLHQDQQRKATKREFTNSLKD